MKEKKQKKQKQRTEFVDDGRTIANMNVEGMPWYSPQKEKKISSVGEELFLSKKEERAMLGGVMKASLMIAGIFGLVFFIFILICVLLWCY